MAQDPGDRLSALSTATVSDALDRLRCPGSAQGIAPLQNGQRMAGRAFTVQYVPVGAKPGTVGDYVDDVEAGQVVVLDNGGRTDCTVWGDILTAVAGRRGIAGTVIDGVCRDTHRALETSYPIYSRGRFMRTGKDRVEASAFNVPVTLGDVSVRPADFVLGDDDGVVVVPEDRVDEVLEVAESIAAREDAILAAALEQGSLRAARATYGYHGLQREEDE